MMRVSVGALLYFIALSVRRGNGLLDLAIPDSGTIVTQFANDTQKLEFFCRILTDDGTRQAVTTWFQLTAEGKAMGSTAGSIEQNNQFSFSGNDITSSGFTFPSSTNLTINGVTTNLHNSTISCGNAGNNSLASFTIYVYENPSAPENFQILFLEDTAITISWQRPSNLGNPPIAYYSLIITDDDGLTFTNERIPVTDNSFSVSRLKPVTSYTISLTAISQLTPVLVTSPTVTQNITTNTTVPVVDCETLSIAQDQTSLRIEWINVHTGGLNLTSATIEYSIISGGNTGNFTLIENPQLDINAGIANLHTLPEAGLNYVFRVTTENDEGLSEPGTCMPIFLTIGTPSTPQVPTVMADGPVALLSLRTANSGNGGAMFPFAFSVLVYQVNSSEAQLVSIQEVFNSSEYTGNETIMVHIEDVMELNQLYRFAVQAVNMFGTSNISPLSPPILLNVSVPSISEFEAQQGQDAVTVTWTFKHTGGLNITFIEILFREDRDGTIFELIPGGNISQPLNDTFDITGSNFQAGVSYEVGLRAINELGSSELSVSKIPDSIIGVPAVPSVPTLYFDNTSSITLLLITESTGLVTPDDILTFRLRITATDRNGASTVTFQTGNFTAEMLTGSVRMTVSAVTGTNYAFSVRAENRFGVSDYSGDSETIPITDPTLATEESDDSLLTMREVIGIAVGAGIVVLLLMACCLLVICAICSRGSGKKKDSVGDEVAMEMIDNNTYNGHKRDSLKNENKKYQFSPGENESEILYEPPPNDKTTDVPLRPKPTHPTNNTTDTNPPLYDSLDQRGRQMSTYSSASREQPNPLYSGTARPSSLHDSGSGTISSRGKGGRAGGGVVVGGVTRSGVDIGEPLYSEASVPTQGHDALYTEPDSRSSKLLESLSGPPPLPPDPRTIPSSSPPTKNNPVISSYDDPKEAPMYAEAGPTGSQEHLYSELPELTNRRNNISLSFPPPFHVPPPPPPTQPPPSSSSPPLPIAEPSYTTPNRVSPI